MKKVRGRPTASSGEGKSSSCITMTLLITLPTESKVSPLLPINEENANEIEIEITEEVEDESHGNRSKSKAEERLMFRSFSFEDYAWRVYHEPLLFKDPLHKYRIIH